MSGVDGEQERGFLMLWDAASLELLYHATAPQLTLFGVHTKFFPFTVGCEQEDCTPQEGTSTTNPQNGTTTAHDNSSSSSSAANLMLIILFSSFVFCSV